MLPSGPTSGPTSGLVVAVVGVGLLGGSVGMALRGRLGARVRGWDPSAEALRLGTERGALDDACSSLAEAVAGAQLVVVAAPVQTLVDALERALGHADPDATVTDVGSIKSPVVEAIDDLRYVGGHPLAGAETSGVAHARADLFDGATWYLTPTGRTDGERLAGLHRVLHRLGARPTTLDPAAHDRVMASVSHLPHVLANVLVAQAARVLDEDAERLPATGPSFRDATRVAGASTPLWTGIYRANATALVAAIDDTVARLLDVRADLVADDTAAISAWNDGAAADRRRLLESGLGGGVVHELRIGVPNRPGVVAGITLQLGEAGIDILDMALYPSAASDGVVRSGTVALWIAGEGPAKRAADLLAGAGLPVARP